MDYSLLTKYLAPEDQDWTGLSDRVSGVMLYESEREQVKDDLLNLKWLPNSPALVQAGRTRNMMACHVLEVEDSITGIFETVKNSARIFKSGGGLGIELSQLSPSGTSLNYAPQGVASGPVSFLKVFDATAQVVAQGGLRRAALMATLNADHPDVKDFIVCKEQDGDLSNFNISVTLDNGPDNVDADVWETLVKHAWYNGEPGLVFLDTINKHNPTLDDFGPIRGVNACVTGDTLVAVADGRDYVSIKDLADVGDDVPVYSQGENGIEVQMGRHPRKTRENVDIIKITFNDGSSIKTTLDHKLMLRNGDYIEASKLSSGDSLMPFYKYQYQQKNRSNYWAVHLNEPGNNAAWAPEHRLIEEYKLGRFLRYPNDVVHHRDYDGLNNMWDNLEVMSAKEHSQIHRQRMLGDSNPMRDGWWNTLLDDEQQEYRDKMSNIFSGSGNPMWGRHHSEKSKQRMRDAAARRDEDYPDLRERISESLKQWFKENGTDHLKGRTAKRVVAICGYCGKEFRHDLLTEATYRARIENNKSGKIFCSLICSNKWVTENTNYQRYSDDDLIQQGIQCWNDLGRLPSTGDWELWRKENGAVSHETIRSRFGGMVLFRQALNNYNHRVVSIVPCGKGDVYNITVDNNHNLAYITNTDDTTPQAGLPRLSGIISKNCGEQPLYNAGSCVLASINLSRIGHDKDEVWRVAQTVTKFLDRIISINHYPIPEIKESTKRTRNLGIGIMGWYEFLESVGVGLTSDEGLRMATEYATLIYEAANEASWELAETYGGYLPGRRRNATLMCVAPTGHISRLAGTTPSIYAPLGLALEMSPEEHIELVGAWQDVVDNAISYTVNIKNDSTPDLVDEVFYLAYDRGLKAICVYRDGSRENQPCTVDGSCSL